MCNGTLTSNSYLSFSPLGLILSKRSSFFRDLNPQHIRSPSEVEATTMQQSGTYRLPDKEVVHYTLPKNATGKVFSIARGHIIVIITQLSRGEARGVICEVVEDRSR